VYGNTVLGGSTTESLDPTIVTADNLGSGAILIARASNATTTVRVTAGSLTKTATAIVLPLPCESGGAPLSLDVGEVATLSGSAASELCVHGTAAGAEFTAIPFYSDLSGSSLRLSIYASGTTAASTADPLSVRRFPSRKALKAQPLALDESF
jgi:hypothetical protein